MRPVEDLLTDRSSLVPDGTKDDRGTLMIVGGPPECPGAVQLAATAALRTGAGRVQVVVHPDVASAVATTVPELLVLGWDLEGPLPERLRTRLRHAGAVVVGPGLGGAPGRAVEQIADVVADRPLLLDAGAFAAIDRVIGHAGLVVAPNLREASRMLEPGAGASNDTDDADGDGDAEAEAVASRLAARLRQAVAVRGATTVLADPDGETWKHQGSDSLGTPGSGDLFIGTLGGLLARDLPVLAALAWATVLHADAGRILDLRRTGGWLARDILDALPDALARRLGR